MRLPEMSERTIAAFEAERPSKGDSIFFEDEIYIVQEIGLRYLVCQLANNPKVTRWIKQGLAIRCTPPVEEALPADTSSLDLYKKFNHIGREH